MLYARVLFLYYLSLQHVFSINIGRFPERIADIVIFYCNRDTMHHLNIESSIHHIDDTATTL